MADITDVTDETFEAGVLQSEMPVVVYFWAPWCGPCRMVAPVLEELAEEYDGRVKFVKLNTDENPGTVGKYDIHSIPTILFFKNGEVKEQKIGFQSNLSFGEIIDGLL